MHARLRVLRKKFCKTVVHAHVHKVPIIQPCPFQIFVGDLKPERPHKMQDAPRRRTGPRNVARVLRDLRFNKYNMKHSLRSVSSIVRQNRFFCKDVFMKFLHFPANHKNLSEKT